MSVAIINATVRKYTTHCKRGKSVSITNGAHCWLIAIRDPSHIHSNQSCSVRTMRWPLQTDKSSLILEIIIPMLLVTRTSPQRLHKTVTGCVDWFLPPPPWSPPVRASYYHVWRWHLLPWALCLPISPWYVGFYRILCSNSHSCLDCIPHEHSLFTHIKVEPFVTINGPIFFDTGVRRCRCAQAECCRRMIRTPSTGVAEGVSGAQGLAVWAGS